MASDNAAAVSAFVEGAPPGELADVIADVKKLTVNEPRILDSITPAFQKYNEEQLITVKLPGSSKNVRGQTLELLNVVLIAEGGIGPDHTALLKSLTTHSTEHYPSATSTVCLTTPTSTLALLLVSNKYSPQNFWNGRWRSTYLFDPSNASTLSGTINVDVHYYEDGNVRLTTTKKVAEMKIEASPALSPAALAAEVLKKIAGVERAYQEELSRGFGRLSEGEFKGLRRQLPVTRQKVEWEKIGGYR
ncbi:MAG: hypothetical protein Q9218_007914, partial [Villophora microphyllina]